MKDSIRSVLGENITAIYLFGSVAMNDFKPGWSDIDLLCLTAETITDEQARKLVNLRQTLSFYEKQPIYFQYFEGAIVAWPAFKSRSCTKVVYWGTGKQRIDHIYSLDPFSEYSLIQNGILLHGADIRAELCLPSYTALRQAVINHYDTIRKYARNTSGSVYACGWLLDIARGIYTLRTGSVIAKTKAGVWALEQRLCPVEHDLKTALTVRNNPLRYKNDPDIREWAAALGPSIQRFADVLEAEIQQTAQPVDNAIGNKIHH